MTDVDGDAGRPQPVEGRRLAQVAARHVVAHLGQDEGDGAHARPADTDDVVAAGHGQVDRHRWPGSLTCSLTGAASRSARPGRRCDRRHRGRRPSGPAHPSRPGAPDPGGGDRPRPAGARRELDLGHQQRTAGAREHLGVGRLVVLGGQRPRHQDRGQADGRQLGHGGGSGSRQHQVGGGVGEVHGVFVAHHLVPEAVGALLRCERRRVVTAADDVADREVLPVSLLGGQGCDHVVQLARAERPAHHEQREAVGRQPERRPRAGLVPGPVDAEDGAAQRGAGDLLAGQRRRVEGDGARRRQAGLQAGRGARHDVVADDDHRDPQGPGREHRRDAGVPADGDDDLRAHPAQQRHRPGRAAPKRPAARARGRGDRTLDALHREEGDVVPGVGHHRGLHAPGGADEVERSLGWPGRRGPRPRREPAGRGRPCRRRPATANTVTGPSGRRSAAGPPPPS